MVRKKGRKQKAVKMKKALEDFYKNIDNMKTKLNFPENSGKFNLKKGLYYIGRHIKLDKNNQIKIN